MRALHHFIFATLLIAVFQPVLRGQTNEVLQSFPSSSPEQKGMSSTVLDSLMQFIKNSHQNIHHITIIRDKRTVLDTDIYPYSSKYLHDIASVTKSVTALLTGIAIDKGWIKDEDEPVLKFFPEIDTHSHQLVALTIKDLITMRSGFACGVEDGEKALSDMRKTKDWINFIFNLPVTSRPGEKFSYCSCNYYLLAEIIYRTTKMIPHEFAKKYLFGPLNIRGTKWLTNDQGMNHGWGDLFLYPTDMIKIGVMVSDKGKWHGRQIVSAQWVTKSFTTVSRLPDDKGYSYGWWTNDKVGYYEAAGRGRQTISVIPSKNMVVIMLGGEFDAGTVGRYIFESVKSDKALPANGSGYKKLQNTLREVAAIPKFTPVAVNNDIVQQLNNRTIVFEKNIAGIDSLKLAFLSLEKGTVAFYKKGIQEKYPLVFSVTSYALGLDPALQLPVALQANGKNDNEFILHYNQLCRINNFYFDFTINGDQVNTTMEETSNFIKINIKSSFTSVSQTE